jgi:sterol desaturase/sphingolipid hydroxylase (fatty acid hydroxylase superfamily)
MWLEAGALLGTYIAVSLFGYGIHRALHQPWTGKLYERHKTHHFTLFPPEDYQSDVYRDPGKDNTVFSFAIASVPMLAAPIILASCGVVGWWLAGAMEIEMLLFGWAADHIHDRFHLTGDPLNKWLVFRRWNARHYQHHVDTQSNLTIFDPFWDKVFGTYKDDLDTI